MKVLQNPANLISLLGLEFLPSVEGSRAREGAADRIVAATNSEQVRIFSVADFDSSYTRSST